MNKKRNWFRSLFDKVLKSKKKNKFLKDFSAVFVESPENFVVNLKNVLFELFDRSQLNFNTKSTLKFVVKVLENLSSLDVPQTTVKKSIQAVVAFVYDACNTSKEKHRLSSLLLLNHIHSSSIQLTEFSSISFGSLLDDLRYDKSKHVRCLAIEIAGKLELYKLVNENMDIDPCSIVRKKCVKIIPDDLLFNKVFENRLKDLSADVRLLALSRYESCSIENIPNSALEIIIFLCFNDTSENVRLKSFELISNAIERVGYKHFCEKIGVEKQILADVLKKNLEKSEKKTVLLHEKMCNESEGPIELFLLRVSCEAMREFNKEINFPIETSLSLIQKNKDNNFALYNLLLMLKCYNLENESSRILFSVNFLCEEVSLKTNKTTTVFDINDQEIKEGEKIIETIIVLIREIHKFQENEYCRVLKSIIDNFLENSEEKNIKAYCEKKINVTTFLKEESVILISDLADTKLNQENKDLMLVKIEENDLKIKKFEDKLEKSTKILHNKHYRALVICCYTLKYCKIKEINHELLGLLDSLIVPCLSFTPLNIRFLALKCLGYYSLLSFETLSQYFWLFVREIEGKSEFEAFCLRFLFDFFLTHDCFHDPKFIQGLVLCSKYLNSKDSGLLNIAVLGFCKIVMLDLLPKSVGILCKLVILFFSEIDDDCRAILSNFFEIFVSIDERKANLVLKALKIYILLKKNERRLPFPIQISGKNMTWFISLFSKSYDYEPLHNFSFSLLYFLTKIFVNDEITEKAFEELLRDLDLSLILPEH